MNNKKILVILSLILGLTTISCFNKKEETANKDTKTEEVTNTNLNGNTSNDIFNLGQTQGNIQNSIDNLTVEEQNVLLNSNIDPQKVSEAIKKAESGDKEAILSLGQLYYSLKDMDKVKKYLKLGVDKNYPEAIYNLAVIYKDEGNMTEANKLISKLPKDMMASKQGLPAGAVEYNKGIEYIKAKKYKLAKEEFEKAYKKGIKDADIRIALLNKELKNNDEALKWFKIAANRGIKEANLEIGAILFDSGKTTESRPYLQKAYNNGNKTLAMPIAISYHKENNISEALKWYKIAAKNGDNDAKKAVEEIETITENNGKTEQQNNTLFLGNEKKSSLTDTTINETKNNKEEVAPTVKTEGSTPLSNNQKESNAKVKNNYNIEIEEIINDEVMKYNK